MPKPSQTSSALPKWQADTNKSFYTQRQFDRAKRACDLYHALGTPLIEDFKAMLRMNTVANNPVTTEDVKIAKQMFGNNIGGLVVSHFQL
jgi:hypothetical protein